MNCLRNSIAGGSVAGSLVGGLDFLFVMRATGPFWLSPRNILEPLAVQQLVGIAVGATLGLVLRALPQSRRPEPTIVFRLSAAITLAFDLSLFLVAHIYDVGLPIGSRMQVGPYAVAILGVLLVAGALYFALGSLARRLSTTTRTHEVFAASLIGVVALALLVVCWAAPNPPFYRAQSEPSPDSPDIILVIVDTTRADGLSIYGNPRSTTPNLDAMGKEGLVFRRAYATSPWTPPSHASLFTGTYPSTHQTVWQSTALKNELPTLAGVFSSLGYQTLFAAGKPLLNRKDGWTRGFDSSFTVNVEDRVTFLHRRLLHKFRKIETATPILIAIVLRWLQAAQESERPFFAFLHLNDPHTIYKEREPYYSKYSRGLDVGSIDRTKIERMASFQDHHERPSHFDLGELAIIRARYDSEVAYADAAIGQMLQWVRDHRRSRRTVVLVTSDHGELLGEHGLFYHRKYPYEELVHIPFLLWSDPPLGIGVSKELVSLVDVFPTLIDLAGGDVSLHPQLQGRRLLRDSEPDAVFAEHWRNTGPDRANPKLVERKAAISERSKLVWQSSGDSSIYDLQSEHGEDRDASTELADEIARLEGVLRRSLDLESVFVPQAREIDAEEINRLRALGYVD